MIGMNGVCRIKAYYSLALDETMTWVAVGDPSRHFFHTESPHSWPEKEIAFATIEGLRVCQERYDQVMADEYAAASALLNAQPIPEPTHVWFIPGKGWDANGSPVE